MHQDELTLLCRFSVVRLVIALSLLSPISASASSAHGESCIHDYECEQPYVCVTVCKCNPLWAHTGTDCETMTWMSWMVVIMLILVIVTSYLLLTASVAKRSLSSQAPQQFRGLTGWAELLSQFISQRERRGELRVRNSRTFSTYAGAKCR